MDSLALGPTWDLERDAQGNIAVATGVAGLAQNAASAARTFRGECWFDTAIGIPWGSEILGRSPALAVVKQYGIDAALTVPGVAAAQCYIQSIGDRTLTGQIQVVDQVTSEVAAASFSVINPQGVG